MRLGATPRHTDGAVGMGERTTDVVLGTGCAGRRDLDTGGTGAAAETFAVGAKATAGTSSSRRPRPVAVCEIEVEADAATIEFADKGGVGGHAQINTAGEREAYADGDGIVAATGVRVKVTLFDARRTASNSRTQLSRRPAVA